MIVLVTGSRDYADRQNIKAWLERMARLSKDGRIVVWHGDAKGADRIAGSVASELGFDVRAFPANWELYKKAAGAIRNTEMLDAGPHIVLAFHKNVLARAQYPFFESGSVGTIDCVVKAHEMGLPVILSH